MNTDEVLAVEIIRYRATRAEKLREEDEEQKAETARLAFAKQERLKNLGNAQENLRNLLCVEDTNQSFRSYMAKLFRSKALRRGGNGHADLILEIARDTETQSATKAFVVALVMLREDSAKDPEAGNVGKAYLDILIYGRCMTTGVDSWISNYDHTDEHLDKALFALSQPETAVQFIVNAFGPQ